MPAFRDFFRPSILCVLLATPFAALRAESWRFVSTPDLFNVDVGDLTRYDADYDGPNSWNADWSAAVDGFFGALVDETPEFVAVAGDLVMARWFQDGTTDGVFGPKLGEDGYGTRDLATEEARVRAAAEFYFGEFRRFFEENGLTPYIATGDHELGDDYSWTSGNQTDDFGKTYGRETVPEHREVLAELFMDPLFADTPEGLAAESVTYNGRPAGGEQAGTAYAIRHRNLLLVSVDVFQQGDPSSAVAQTVTGEQLTWLEDTLAMASADPDIDHIVVQAHTPVLQPVDTRVSGNLKLAGGTGSAFWQALKTHGVDLYLTGEVHDVTVSRESGGSPVQIAHGGILGFPNAVSRVGGRGNFISYLVAEVSADRIDLTIKKIDLHFPNGSTTGKQDAGLQFFQPGNPFTALVKEFSLVNPGAPEVMGAVSLRKGPEGTEFAEPTGVFSGLPAETPGETLGRYRFDTTGDASGFTLDASVQAQPEGASFSLFGESVVGLFLDGDLNQDHHASGDPENGEKWPGTDGGGGGSAFDPSKYVGFTVEADPGKLVEPEALAFQYNRGGGRAPTDGRVRVLADGEPVLTETFMTDESSINTDVPALVDLSALGAARELEFRFQFKDQDTADGFTPSMRLDNVELTGVVRDMTGLESWRLDNFGDHRNAENAANSADPDDDRFANLAEYAFGADPLDAADVPVGALEVADVPDSGGVTLSVLRRAGEGDGTMGAGYSVGGVTYTLLAADSLAVVDPFGADSACFTDRPPADSAGPGMETLEVDAGGGLSAFYRVRVEAAN